MTNQPVGVAPIDREQLQRHIAEKYGEVALNPESGFHFHTGRPLAAMLGYPDELLVGLPESSVVSFAGTGNPFAFDSLAPGEVVVDVGCGAGMDTLIAARQVGPTGRVFAIDMTPEMRQKVQASVQALGLTNVAVLEGFAESLPVPDGTADVVLSNGVVNLCPDKQHVFREMYRVLKPGGRMQIADILVHKEVPPEAKADIDLWSGWIAGALLEAEWRQILQLAGFTDVVLTNEIDVFSGSTRESDAREFETRGVTIFARRPSA